MISEEDVKRRRTKKRPVVKSAGKDVNNLAFQAVCGSHLTLWHRPKIQHLSHIKDIHQVTLVITAQADRERPLSIAKECKRLGLKWIQIPLEGANQALLSKKSTLKIVSKRLAQVLSMLKSGNERAFLHWYLTRNAMYFLV